MSDPIKRKKKGKLLLQDEDLSKLTTSTLLQQLIEAREDLIKQNNILKEKQLRNEKQIEGDDSFKFIYPHQDDPNFNSKIISKKEFNDIIHEKKERPISEYSDEICNKKIFELLPHQLFVRNYLSFNTPYNSILMFHGLGSGKTCSSITITEMMRSYLNQLGVAKRIIIVASPNVQTNFRTQLFDERRLEEVNGIWNLNACTGNKFIKEINPMNMKGLSRKDVIKLIKRIINKSYLFLGQEQFANYIASIISKYTNINKQRKYLKHEFSNRMIVIDEVHNIRITTDNPNSKKISKQLMFLVENTDNLKLLLLTATPMFNNNTEIIWLLNIMNANDNRPTIKTSEVFDKDNNLIVSDDGTEVGKELLIRKSRSYVSYMRGENPYFFPFKITPSMFLTNNTIAQYIQPDQQMNELEIVQPIQYLDLYYTQISPYQQSIYSFIIEHVKEKSKKKGIGYQLLTLPLQCLTMTYPNVNFDTKLKKYIEDGDESKLFELPDLQMMVGKRGLSNTMRYDSKTKRKFEYKQNILKKYGRIFSKDNIVKYSPKIYFITQNALHSDGVILIYSQYIDGGCIPIALALEELGFSRYGKQNNLFNVNPPEKTKYSYAMITGDILISPNNGKEINVCTSDDNKNGDIIKVIIISEAGSEGIDLKFIRQVHIIDPWYNLGRIEQITGRAIRNCSHKILPLKDRNVELYMHASELLTTDIESADVYLYRISEYKAIKIGEVARILKESSVDCLVNKDIKENLDTIEISLSSKKTLKYTVGDLSYSYTCDYMRNCNYECNAKVGMISLDTYNDTYITLNNDIIINRIKELFKDGYVFSKADIIGRINYVKNYPLIQINSALSRLVNDNSEFVYDYYNNTGKIINIGLYYLYQPINIETKHLSMYERMNTPQKINKKVRILLKDDIIQKETNTRKIIKSIERNINYSLIYKEDELLKEKDLNWYKAAGKFFNTRNMVEIEKDLYLTFVIRHYLDTVDFDSKLQLFNYVLSKTEKDMTDIERRLIGVFKEYIILTKYVIIADPRINNLSYFTIKDNVLVASKPTDKERLIKHIIKTYEFDLNALIGFMGNFKKKYSVFKIKNTKNVRDTGFRADQKGKLDILKMLNTLTDNNDIYTYENTRKISNSKELCIDEELLFRYYHEIKKDEKHWFLSQENFIINSYLSKK